MNYGYIRLSLETQNIACQMIEIKELGLSDEVIFIDKQRKITFKRGNYKLLKRNFKRTVY